MKKNLLLSVICIMIIISGCTGNRKSQIEQPDTISAVQTDTVSNSLVVDEAIQMLIEFYTVYNKTWKEIESPAKEKQLDSLRQKYCTKRLREWLKELGKQWGGFEFAHDVLICDFYTDDLESLKVTKDNDSKNVYWVAYTAMDEIPGGKKFNYNIKIQVSVIKEDGVFKIDDILNPDSCFRN
jgi:hypothetical protein